MADIKILIVVDGIFRLGPRDLTDNTFTISNLISVLENSTSPIISVDTANRNDLNQSTPDTAATISGNFNFATTIPNLSMYNEIWMFGYSGTNPYPGGPSPPPNLAVIQPEEIAAIAAFMDRGGGVLASGDHAGLGSLMCGLIPRVRTMRRWFALEDIDTTIPTKASRNFPGLGEGRADTLQPAADGSWNFDNQSDDIPQPLKLVGSTPHPILQLPGGGVINSFPDHMHEGEVLGNDGTNGSKPWSLNETLTFAGQSFVEYPTVNGYQEQPQIIAKGSIIGGHPTPVTGATCEINNFHTDTSNTISTYDIIVLSVYDGQNVNVGRVITDSSFHHYLDLNIIGDPCGNAGTTEGFQTTSGQQYYNNMTTFYINAAQWLSGPRVNFSLLVTKNTFGFDEVQVQLAAHDVGDSSIWFSSFFIVLDGYAPEDLPSSSLGSPPALRSSAASFSRIGSTI